jgi:MtN3 and saliva related transmembrane protein
MNLTVLGIIAGVLTASAMVPQLVKIVRTKKADDISIPTLFILLAGLCIWVYYGIRKDDLPLILTNSVSVLITALNIFFSSKYKKK